MSSSVVTVPHRWVEAHDLYMNARDLWWCDTEDCDADECTDPDRCTGGCRCNSAHESCSWCTETVLDAELVEQPDGARICAECAATVKPTHAKRYRFDISDWWCDECDTVTDHCAAR